MTSLRKQLKSKLYPATEREALQQYIERREAADELLFSRTYSLAERRSRLYWLLVDIGRVVLKDKHPDIDKWDAGDVNEEMPDYF